ncbi:H(+)-transporting V1 sector ATPase subunit D [Phlyctochytrium planicorne]|nr:H(+)-transporting V1 sector ATPase subunit D [Phlyctochytrium planicorne]
MKNRLKGAHTGHSLLKRKSEALTRRFRDILKKIDEAKRKMGKVMQVASFSYAEVKYSTGDISFQVRESVKTAQLRVRANQENVSGVQLPTFDMYVDGQNAFELTGLGRGGQQVQKCKDTYQKAVEVLVQLASLQTAFVILDEVIKVTNRRVNAIEHVIIPKIENTIRFITSELDEQDREEFFRLKKVQAKKKIKKDIEDAEREAAGSTFAGKSEAPAAKNIMSDYEEDPDVIF